MEKRKKALAKTEGELDSWDHSVYVPEEDKPTAIRLDGPARSERQTEIQSSYGGSQQFSRGLTLRGRLCAYRQQDDHLSAGERAAHEDLDDVLHFAGMSGSSLGKHLDGTSGNIVDDEDMADEEMEVIKNRMRWDCPDSDTDDAFNRNSVPAPLQSPFSSSSPCSLTCKERFCQLPALKEAGVCINHLASRAVVDFELPDDSD